MYIEKLRFSSHGSDDVFLVALGDLRLFLVAFMEVKPVAEGDTFTCGDREVAFGFVR